MTRQLQPHGWLLSKIWAYMHVRTCHAYDDMQRGRWRDYPNKDQRWRSALRRFEQHHMADRGLRLSRASVRFVNRYTAHRWM
jgi:hypothetical protein